MYVDKPMRGHTLMQAIARVNRVFRDKPGGLVVDYLGIADDLRKALAVYSDSGGEGEPTVDQDEAVAVTLEKLETCRDIFYGFERRMLLGPAWSHDDFVIDDGIGRPLDPDRFGKAFQRASKRAGVRGFRLHDVRHAFITRLVAQGIDAATVSRIAGHATVAFTLQTYYHPGATEAQGIGAAIDAALGS